MNNPQRHTPQHGDTLPNALADIVQFLKRKREAREARQTAGTEDKRGAHE